MALIDRVKERVETDLTDAELASIIAEAQAEIRQRWGPDADSASPITVTTPGGDHALNLYRPLDAEEAIVVAETVSGGVSGETTTTLAADDYRVWYGGRALERLAGGTNSRSRWGDRVAVTYTPVDDTPQREEVVIKLVQLAVEYEGLDRRSVGDTTADHLDYPAEREKLIASLSPRKGLLIA